jgi:hypothetical protein
MSHESPDFLNLRWNLAGPISEDEAVRTVFTVKHGKFSATLPLVGLEQHCDCVGCKVCSMLCRSSRDGVGCEWGYWAYWISESDVGAQVIVCRRCFRAVLTLQTAGGESIDVTVERSVAPAASLQEVG